MLEMVERVMSFRMRAIGHYLCECDVGARVSGVRGGRWLLTFNLAIGPNVLVGSCGMGEG